MILPVISQARSDDVLGYLPAAAYRAPRRKERREYARRSGKVATAGLRDNGLCAVALRKSYRQGQGSRSAAAQGMVRAYADAWCRRQPKGPASEMHL